MRKILYWFGLLSVTTIVAIIGIIGYVAHIGYTAFKESRSYAETSIVAITAHWDATELISRATPELRRTTRHDQFQLLFDQFGALGPLTKYEGAEGGVNMTTWAGEEDGVTANYTASVQYKNASARIKLGLLRIDSRWMINGFRVESPWLENHGSLKGI